jgi:predicted negative regulator of RcsB-dependent stress response
MNKILKFTMNTTLLAIFLGMLLLPAGFMGLMNFEEDSNVLSAQDSKQYDNTFKSLNDPDSQVPVDIEEMILKMEKEYYENQKNSFSADIERTEEQEIIEENIEIENQEVEEDLNINQK